MKDEKLLSITQKSLFLKSALLSMAVIGIVLAQPVTSAVQSGAHRICQLSMKSVVRCQAFCYDNNPGARAHNLG